MGENGSRSAIRQVALLCHPYHRGGVTGWMVAAAAAWHERGTRTWFGAPAPRVPFESGSGPRPVLGLLRGRLPESQIAALPVDRRFEFGLPEYRARLYVRIVRARVPAGVPLIVSDDTAVWMAGAALAARNPMIGVLHADEEHYYALARRSGPALAGLVAVSSRIADRGISVAPENVPFVTIPCGIPMPVIDLSSGRRGAPHRLVWVGRVEERQKRVSDLPRIVAAVHKLGLSCELDVIGDGPDRDALAQSVAAMGLSSRIRFHGWRDGNAVMTALAAADALLLPSNFEGMPIVAMEALSAGCAVVASATSGLEEYRNRPHARQCIFTYAVGDIDAAASAVRQAMSVSFQARRSAARTLADTEFSLTNCLDRYDAFLDQCAARRGRPLEIRGRPTWMSHAVATARLMRVQTARWVRT